MQPYILFALARTGSTTLLNLLACRSGLRCVFEPFNPTNVNPHLAKCTELRKQHGVLPVVTALWRGCNGFKHVWEANGWPFLDNPDANRQILVDTNAKIILMHRVNKLRRAMSVQISEQMKLWTPYLPEHFEQIRSHTFAPLDIPALKKEIDDSAQAQTWARGQLHARSIPFIEITYEGLFEKNLSMDSRMAALNSVLNFIGVGPETDPERLKKMHDLFNPETTGFQNADAYSKIPNINEVDAALSSLKNGYVFDAPPSAMQA